MPVLTQRQDGSWAVDYGPPGPFLVLTQRQLLALALAMHNTEIITLARLNDPRPVR